MPNASKYGLAALISVAAGFALYRFVAKREYKPLDMAVDAAIGVAGYWALSKGGWANAIKGVSNV